MSAPISPERGPNRCPDGPPSARGHLERLIGHCAELTGVALDRPGELAQRTHGYQGCANKS